MAEELTVKLQTGFTCTDGSKENRTVGHIAPDATEEAIMNVAAQLGTLVDPTVKTMSEVKRVETANLGAPAAQA